MISIAAPERLVTGGVDTHLDVALRVQVGPVVDLALARRAARGS